MQLKSRGLAQILVDKYTKKGFSGDSLWEEIIEAAARSRKSINQQLGLE